MNELSAYMPIAEQAADMIEYLMIDQLGLAPPANYELTGREDRAYLVASFDTLALGKNLKPYENDDIARRLSTALASLPVVITKRTGTRYVVVLSGRPKLPKLAKFPGFGRPDRFRLGVSLRGEISHDADVIQNVIIGAGQGAGKSNLLYLFAFQAWKFGWRLYLADPDAHTFNPDVWNQIAAMPVAQSPEDVYHLLDRLVGEIADRAALFRKMANGGIPPANLSAYNEISEAPLPRIALVMDEANTALGDRRVFAQTADLLRRGRKWGLHVFLAGHEWHKENIPAEVNDMLQTRIGLNSATAESGQVVLRSTSWGKWVLHKKPGRGVIRTGKYIPLQFYYVSEDQQREFLAGVVTPAPIPEEEAVLVARARIEAGGKMSIPLLVEWGMAERAARAMVEDYESRGWLEKDPARSNARYITSKLTNIVKTGQSGQTMSNPLEIAVG